MCRWPPQCGCSASVQLGAVCSAQNQVGRGEGTLEQNRRHWIVRRVVVQRRPKRPQGTKGLAGFETKGHKMRWQARGWRSGAVGQVQGAASRVAKGGATGASSWKQKS